MNDEKVCGCTGVRSCLLCKKQKPDKIIIENKNQYWYCPSCKKIFQGDLSCLPVDSSYVSSWCVYHEGGMACKDIVKGIHVFEEFISDKEEEFLVSEINKQEWKLSQSGRRKQDFGPKPNFKRKKLKLGNFSGLPAYVKFLVNRINEVNPLRSFIAVELCNLEYTPERGSSIDPHIDDIWLWGEQLVTVNLLSRTFLTLSCSNLSMYIPMSQKSLIILEDEARYKWLHSINRSHINKKRIAMTFRNLSSEFEKVEGTGYEVGQEIIKIAQSFEGTVNL